MASTQPGGDPGGLCRLTRVSKRKKGGPQALTGRSGEATWLHRRP